MSQQTFEQFRDERLNALGLTLADLTVEQKLHLNDVYASQQGKYIHVPVYHPSHVSITHASHVHHAVYFEITLYFSSHFSYSSAAFRKIAQAGGGGQGQGDMVPW